jgi:hypothetical protein
VLAEFTYQQMTLKSFGVVDYDLKGAMTGISGKALAMYFCMTLSTFITNICLK